jgi:acetolactate synthase-1/2/3 large subunit
MMAEELCVLGYSHCFYLAGGNIMHLVAAFSQYFEMVPVLHEVTAIISVDAFNELSSRSNLERNKKAFALVTVGPGLTQAVTGIVGSFIDSREVLIIGGQVKSTDLKNSAERQRGMQEVDGISLIGQFTKFAKRVKEPISREEFRLIVSQTWKNRKGPVFIEVCLDIQGTTHPNQNVISDESKKFLAQEIEDLKNKSDLQNQLISFRDLISKSKRPLLLLGGGVSLSQGEIEPLLQFWGLPVATTWNAADRVSASSEFYAGRPNWWGQRWANFVIQQCDLLIVVGSSLGFHQTGFNLESFAPSSALIQIDIDSTAFSRLESKKSICIRVDANQFLSRYLVSVLQGCTEEKKAWQSWIRYIQFLRQKLPLVEESTMPNKDFFINPYHFIHDLISNFNSDLNIVPCSSGGAYTCTMQVVEQKPNHLIVSSKGLGSMGYGIPAAIGAAFANNRITFCIEGDGGILQNIQDLGTIAINNLPIKLFVMSNSGYASIRGTQKNYFEDKVFGCDVQSGVGIPDFGLISRAFGIEYQIITKAEYESGEWRKNLMSKSPELFEVLVSPEQNFHPRIESKLLDSGTIISNPIHKMYPELNYETEKAVSEFLIDTKESNE